jgi:Gas vesicle synthesis protein GvpL/GvpF
VTCLYAYAAASARPVRLGSGADREPLRVVEVGPVFVVVGERKGSPLPTEGTLRSHDGVVRAVVRAADAVIPFRFASCFADESALKRDLDPIAGELRDALALVDGCDQMTARLFDPRRSPSPPAEDTLHIGTGQGTRYLAHRAAVEREPEGLRTLCAALKPLVRAERVERHSVPPLVATVYHLVERTQRRAYAAAVRRVVRSLGPATVTLSGPWPAYAFARGA